MSNKEKTFYCFTKIRCVKMCEKLLLIFSFIFIKEVLSENAIISRQKRIIPAPPPFLPPMLFTQNAATGILVAIGTYKN